MGGASPTFIYDWVAHVSAHTRPSPSLRSVMWVQGEGLGTRLLFMCGSGQERILKEGKGRRKEREAPTHLIQH